MRRGLSRSTELSTRLVTCVRPTEKRNGLSGPEEVLEARTPGVVVRRRRASSVNAAAVTFWGAAFPREASSPVPDDAADFGPCRLPYLPPGNPSPVTAGSYSFCRRREWVLKPLFSVCARVN